MTILARDGGRLEEAKCAVEAADGKDLYPARTVATLAADVTAHEEVTTAIRKIHASQPIDVLICNAGIVRPGYLEDLPAADVDVTVSVNLLGSIYPIQAVLPLMKARGHMYPGSIVMMCSMSGLAFWYGAAVYTATKYAQRGLAEALRAELLSFNIKVTLVCPGFTDTPLLENVEASGRRELCEMMRVANRYDPRHLENPRRVAERALWGARHGTFLVPTSPTGGMLAMLTRGLFPADSWLAAALEAVIIGPVRLLTMAMAFGLRADIRAARRKSQNSRLDG